MSSDNMTWKSVIIENTDYMVKWVEEADYHKIFLTDIVNLWMEEITTTTIFDRCKDLNPRVEGDAENLIKYVRSLICGTDSVTLLSNVCEQYKTLDIKSKLAGITDFHFTFKMKKLDSEAVFQHVTLPLMMVIKQLHKEQDHLCQIIKSKDAEIEQYKFEGATLQRKKLETKPFTKNDLCLVTLTSDEVDKNVLKVFEPWLCKYIRKVEESVMKNFKKIEPETYDNLIKQEAKELHENLSDIPEPEYESFKLPIKQEQTTSREDVNEETVAPKLETETSVKQKMPVKKKPKLRL